jgi:hypothetical protein
MRRGFLNRLLQMRAGVRTLAFAGVFVRAVTNGLIHLSLKTIQHSLYRLFTSLCGFTPSPLTGEGWGEGEEVAGKKKPPTEPGGGFV